MYRATSRSIRWGVLSVLLTLVANVPAALGDGLIVDEDVLQMMIAEPEAEHALILTVALNRAPLDLHALLPTISWLLGGKPADSAFKVEGTVIPEPATGLLLFVAAGALCRRAWPGLTRRGADRA